MPSSFSVRQQRLQARLIQEGLDALWVTSLINIRYLTGFTGSYAQLLVAGGKCIFFSDSRYEEQAANEVHGCDIRIFRNAVFSEILATEIQIQGWRSIAYEARHLNCEAFDKQKTLTGPSVRWNPNPGWIEEMRMVKDETELDLIRRSSKIVDRVFADLLPSLREGVTESGIRRIMLNLFWEHGAKGPSFEPIVLFGARTSMPHGQPSEAALKPGDWVLLDFGVVYEGHCSDCTRTFVFSEPDALQRERHHLVYQAYCAGLEAARPGAACSSVDAVARNVLEKAGLAHLFGHGLGHGVGLEIHEAPRLAQISKEILQPGMVVTIEPGIYIPGWGGIRIENAVIITEQAAEPLTGSNPGIDPRN